MMAEQDVAVQRGYVEWGEGPQRAQIETVDELDVLLDRVEVAARDQQRSVLAVIFLDGASFLTVGLGAAESFVGVDDQSTGQTWWSRGDRYQDDDEVEFYLGNQGSYYPRWVLIPAPTVREVVREMFTTGRRPDSIRWDEP
ncbi:Imm1 family immunity protein [Frankia sp. Cr1]|uniref:Imm1 family immunity protein n=1 Tax=Frankia sp. Cr1 TaxID=3073931 RepID=UPI002AD54E8B|nr:Imm1 family immunity protein [Frankia sp. Cr1]